MPKRSSVRLGLPILVVAALLGRCGAEGRSPRQLEVSTASSAARNSAPIQSINVAREDATAKASDMASTRPRPVHAARTERARSASLASAQVSSPSNVPPKSLSAKEVARIKRQLIQQSIDEYDGSCPCPYNVARNGSSCGRRSAYSRPGGAAPLCYPGDVSDEMVAAWQAEAKQ